MERIIATYHVETPYEVAHAAQVLAGEQSSGIFVAVPGETESLKQRFAAKWKILYRLKRLLRRRFPGNIPERGIHRARIEL